MASKEIDIVEAKVKSLLNAARLLQAEVNDITTKAKAQPETKEPTTPEGKMRVRLQWQMYGKDPYNVVVDVPMGSQVHFEHSQKTLTVRDSTGSILYAHAGVQQAWVEEKVEVHRL